MSQSIIVKPEWLHEQLQAGKNFSILDIRFSREDPEFGQKSYSEGHLPGALFVNFRADIIGKVEQHGGGSPVPPVAELKKLFSRLGLEPKTPVIIYEQANGSSSARLWWTLKFMGHQEVFVLAGGIEAWTALGYEVTADEPEVVQTQYKANVQDNLFVSIEEVREVIAGNHDALLIDSRPHNDYVGSDAPRTGHIPTAKLAFWKDVFDEQGAWKDIALLKQQFSPVEEASETIVYCGSGVSACLNVIALEEAGHENVRLYVGSWSDWISYDDTPIAKGEG